MCALLLAALNITAGMINVCLVQMGKNEKPRPLDDPTRPYIKFDIVAHLDSLSHHEGKRVSVLAPKQLLMSAIAFCMALQICSSKVAFMQHDIA